jgi:hypothetical protein
MNPKKQGNFPSWRRNRGRNEAERMLGTHRAWDSAIIADFEDKARRPQSRECR